MRQIAIVILCVFASLKLQAVLSIDTELVKRAVVFIYGADANGNVDKNNKATGFLVLVPRRGTTDGYALLITARHVIDPVWADCSRTNPTRVFIRVNRVGFDETKNESGVEYIPIDLSTGGHETWYHSNDDYVDAAVMTAPTELFAKDSGGKFEYDVKLLNVRNFGKAEEIAKIGIGSEVASAGLVPGLEGVRRNYPVFKFGKIASIPDEMPLLKCEKNSFSKPLRIWWLAANFVKGNSGAPIFFAPLFPPGGAITSGEPRAMVLGLQSIAVDGADISGMTPAKYILDIIRGSMPADADLTLGYAPN